MTTDRTPAPSRVVTIVPRNMAGQYKSKKGKDGKKGVNHHPASHERGDNTTRTIGWRVAIREEEAALWGVPFVREHESGRGIPVFDGVTRLGDRVSVKEVTRENPDASTSVVLTTPSEGSIAPFGAAIMKGCPVVVIHHRDGIIDLDRMTFKVIDARAILADAGGDLAQVRDRTGAGHPGRGGSGTIWGKWVSRVDTLGREYGHYWEVSISTRTHAWQVGSLEDIEAQVAAILRG